ncbi:MAG: Hsp20/alpha crystallin family protein [Nitrospiria bacterium]
MTIRTLVPKTFSRSISPFNLRAIDPFFTTLSSQVDSIFDDLSRDFKKKADIFNPPLNIVENDKEIKVSLELPGVDEKDVDVSLREEILTIKGEKRTELKDEKENICRLERSYGTFQRNISLPTGIDEGKTSATFEKGILTITLPKTEETPVSVRQIPLKTA